MSRETRHHGSDDSRLTSHEEPSNEIDQGAERSRAHHLSHFLLDRRSGQIQMREDSASGHDESAQRDSGPHGSATGLSQLLLERRQAAIQQRSSATGGREDPHRAAARGISSPATSLPHRDRIQASFGPDHDLSSIQAHVGGDSAAGMGAKAYASGDHVVFDSAPDLHTAAHEAAHVVQQSRGISLYGGVGKPALHEV